MFTFTSDVKSDFANGVSTIKPSDDKVEINTLTFTVPTGYFFTDLDFSTLDTADVYIAAHNGGTGGTLIGTFSATNEKNGDLDWLTVAINAKLMDTIVISSDISFKQLKQFSISGLVSCGPNGSECAPVPSPTPVPGALPLFVSGAGLLGFLGWRRKRRTATMAV